MYMDMTYLFYKFSFLGNENFQMLWPHIVIDDTDLKITLMGNKRNRYKALLEVKSYVFIRDSLVNNLKE